MKKQKLASLLLAAALVLALASGCSPAASPTPTAVPTPSPTPDASITVTDMTGREVKLPSPAKRIVVTTASDCEILFAIGAGGSIVGRGTYCNYPAEAASITAVKSGSDTNIEEIIALQPDLVVMGTMAQSDEQINLLAKAGINVLVSDSDTIADVYTCIGMLGKATGRDADAAALIADMKSGFDAVKTRASLSAYAGRTVYFEVSPLEWGLWAAGKNTFMDEIAAMLNLTNAFADVDGWGSVSEEQVIARNPDYIVTTTMYFGEGPTPVEELMARKGWSELKAVAGKTVFNADQDAITRPGPRLVEAAEAFCDFVYGSAK